MWHIGVDEAGRGPVIGPLVVTAFACPQADLALLVDQGVTDSKLLTATRRHDLANWLRREREDRGWRIETISSSPADIDRAMAHSTLNAHEVDLFARVVRRARPDPGSASGGGIIELDACDTDERRFGNLVASRLPDWPWREWSVDSRHGADLHLAAVGAASILAKEARDVAVRALATDLDIEIGSGYPSDPATIAAIPALLTGEAPHEAVRWRWATIERAWLTARGEAVPERPPDPDAPPTAQRTLF